MYSNLPNPVLLTCSIHYVPRVSRSVSTPHKLDPTYKPVSLSAQIPSEKRQPEANAERASCQQHFLCNKPFLRSTGCFFSSERNPEMLQFIYRAVRVW